MANNHSRELPSSLRLKKRKDFLHIQAKGKKLYTRHYLVLVQSLPNANLHADPPLNVPNFRFGVTVSRKVDKRAVIRNKIRRRVKEVFRLNQHKIKGPIDIVIIARTNALKCTLKEAEKEILSALRQHGFLIDREI